MTGVIADSAIGAIFSPGTIAVLGASSDPKKFGHRLVKNLRADGFTGLVYPVNRNTPEIAGYATVPSLRDIKGPIDLVLICVPADQVEAGVADAAGAHARAAVIYSAGFAEAGPDGIALQASLLERARSAKLRIVGPNCLGVRNFHYRMNAMPGAAAVPGAGPIAFISQSGAFGNAASAAFKAAGIGLSKLASIGNVADVQHAELIRYCGDDPDTAVISVFVEGVRDVDSFLDAISSVASFKPVVVLKGGRSVLGQAAALSHTSSLAGDGRIWETLLREAGATVAESSEDLFDASIAFARNTARMPRGRRVAIVTTAGGPAVVAADHCFTQNLELPMLEQGLAPIRSQVARFASLRNPVDLTGQTGTDAFVPAIKAVADLENVDGIVGICIGLTIPGFVQGMVEASAVKPVVTCVLAPAVESILTEGGVANYPSVERSVRAMRHMADRGAWLSQQSRDAEAPRAKTVPLSQGNHSEAASKSYLAGFGLPVTGEAVVGTIEEGFAAAARIGYPVALKVSSDEILHKSDRGGVLLDIASPEAFRSAFASMQQKFPGANMLVQQMVPKGVELIVGAQRGQGTGPVIMVGIGGILTEILDDVAFCRAPASEAAVLGALSSLRSQQLLDGYRGQKPINRKAVARIGAHLSAIMAANPSIVEVDLNPVISWPEDAIIVDALIRVDSQPS